MKTISREITGQNSMDNAMLVEVIDAGPAGMLQILITREQSVSMSYAMINRWSGSAWELLHHRLHGSIKTLPVSSAYGEKTAHLPLDDDTFKEDRDELLRVALAILA